MLTLLRRRLGADRPDDREGGFTLVETLVAIIIFSLVMGVFMAAVVQMTGTTRTASATGDSVAQLDAVMLKLDRQVRYASYVSSTVTDAAGNTYVEFQIGTGTNSTCYGWRYDPTLDAVQDQAPFLASTDPSSSPSWTTVASGIVTPTAAQLSKDGNSTYTPIAVSYTNANNGAALTDPEISFDFFAQADSDTSVTTEASIILAARNYSGPWGTNACAFSWLGS